MKMLITGASGIIGNVLMQCLSEKNEVVGIDRFASEGVTTLNIVNEQEKLQTLFKGVDTVIHLAWDIKEAGTTLSPGVPENKKMGEVMYNLALEQGVKRFILASSVHVSFGHLDYKHPGIVEDHNTLHTKRVTIADDVFPLGTYGASKVYLEALGKAYSAKGLQVVAVRFGNVTRDDSFGEYPFWLSHRDCCHFITRCLKTKNLPNFSVFYAVSNNPCNPFDLSDAQKMLGYEPQDASSCSGM